MSNHSWGPGFCFPLNLWDSPWVSRHLWFLSLFLLSLHAAVSCREQAEHSQSRRGIVSGCWGTAPLQSCCMTALPEPALQSQDAQNHGRLGTWWDAVLEHPKQEEMRVAASQSSAPTEGECGVPWGMVEVISGKKSWCYQEWGHLSAPRKLRNFLSIPSNPTPKSFKMMLKRARLRMEPNGTPAVTARLSGIDWDFCANILCAVIHVKGIETEMRSKFQLDLKYAKYKIWWWWKYGDTCEVEL